MSLLVSFEVALAIIETVMFAIMVYQRVEKRKKLKTSIAVTIFVILAIIISFYFNIILCKTFEINKFISAFLISTSGTLIIFSIFLLIIPWPAKIETDIKNAKDEDEGNKYVNQNFGEMYTDKNRSKRL